MYKMIAIDLDDTLLTDDLVVSNGTIQAIQKAMDLGIVVTLATGRMFASAKKIAQHLGLNVPLITYQGALIKDAVQNKVIYERLIQPDISRRLIDIARKKKLHLQVYQDDILYTASENEFVRHYYHSVKVPYTVEPNLEKLADGGFTKVLFIDAPDYLDQLQSELRAEFGKCAHVTKSKPFYLEVTHPEANKGAALLHLARKFGINQSEIIGIGDSYNDMDLILNAGLGIVVENGVDELKQKAGYITRSNNEEGVRHAIEKFILNPLAAVPQ